MAERPVVRMTPSDVETASGIPARTIRRWAAQGRLVDHGDGHRILVDSDEAIELDDLRVERGTGRLPDLRSGRSVS